MDVIRNDIRKLGSDNIPVFGGDFEGGIHLQQNISEIVDLVKFLMGLNRKFNNFLEVGSAAGGNTFVLNKYLGFENVVIVDDNNHPKHGFRKETLKDIKRVEFIGNSQSKEANEWVKSLNMEFDIMFIDADHSYEGVRNDTYNYIEFLNDDGYVIFHDTYCCEGIVRWRYEMKNGIFPFLNPVVEFHHQDTSWPKGISIFQKK